MTEKVDYVESLMELMLLEERRAIEPEKYEYLAAGATRQRVKNSTTVTDTILDNEDRRLEALRSKKGARPLTAEEKAKINATYDECKLIMRSALETPKKRR